jgi:hypothetical protein
LDDRGVDRLDPARVDDGDADAVTGEPRRDVAVRAPVGGLPGRTADHPRDSRSAPGFADARVGFDRFGPWASPVAAFLDDPQGMRAVLDAIDRLADDPG